MSESGAPALRRGFRLRYDETRAAWILLAPERLFMLDETAAEVLQLVDGTRTVPHIVEALAARYGGPRDQIEGDVQAMLRDLAEKGAIQL